MFIRRGVLKKFYLEVRCLLGYIPSQREPGRGTDGRVLRRSDQQDIFDSLETLFFTGAWSVFRVAYK